MNIINKAGHIFMALAGIAVSAAKSAEVVGSPARNPTSTGKLNFIFFLVDDLGWADNSINGSKCYETPNLDRLAKQGMTFTNAYSAAALCSPTRASILTGKYPARLHLTHVLGPADATGRRLSAPSWTKYMGLEEITIAEALKATGYATGSFGKWHLEGRQNYTPGKQGFDETTFGRHVTKHFFPYYPNAPFPEGQRGEYLTDRLTADAVRFIEQKQDKPFFVYLSHYAVHVSSNGQLEAKAEYIDKYKEKAACENKNATYAAMIQSVDQSLGCIMDKLEELKIADRTVIIFTSDNGGWEGVTSNAPLRGGKASEFEGGIRVPVVIKWPAEAKMGSVCSEPVISTDFYPTLLEMAGAPLMPQQHADGASLIPLLKQTGKIAREALYWHFPHYHADVEPWGAVRKGEWKLIEYFEREGADRYALFNLGNDIAEKSDLARKEPVKTLELQDLLKAWQRSVGAQMPSANPQYR